MREPPAKFVEEIPVDAGERENTGPVTNCTWNRYQFLWLKPDTNTYCSFQSRDGVPLRGGGKSEDICHNDESRRWSVAHRSIARWRWTRVRPAAPTATHANWRAVGLIIS